MEACKAAEADLFVLAFVTLYVPLDLFGDKEAIVYHPSLLPLHRGRACCAVQGALNIERHNVLSMEELRKIDQPPTRYKTDGGGGVSHLAQALVAPGKARLKGAFAAGVLK